MRRDDERENPCERERMPTQILMPALSPTMTEGTLAKWVKKEGDKVKPGDVIAEIETDKATMEVEAVDEGILGKILVSEGTQAVAVNTPIALLLADGENASDTAKSSAHKPVSAASSSSSSPTPPMAKDSAPKAESRTLATPVTKPAEGARIFASPLAKRIAKDRGVDLSALKGSGPHGRIVRADVEGVKGGASVGMSQGTARKSASGPDARQLADLLGMSYTAVPNSGVRKVIAARLSESKQTVPHFYLTIDCRIDALLAARKALNENGDGKFKLSVNDFVIKAAAMALKAYPAANVAWTDESLLQFEHADISVAVATPAGLITPIVKAAETKSVVDISNEMKDLAKRARDGKLKPTEFQGGTFSVSNLGMYGIKDFAAIINPPQACILAVGAGVEQAVVNNGKIEIGTLMGCTLSLDHRAVDGAVGAEWLQAFKKYIENPIMMLM